MKKSNNKNHNMQEEKATPEMEQNNGASNMEEQPDKTSDTSAEQAEEAGAQEQPDNTNDWELKYNELNNSHLRLMAEFDNYRKRTIKEKADLIKNAGERIIVDFLPIIDNFERALQNMQNADDVEAVRTGVELIYKQVMGMMKNNGVAVIETENLPLDTEYHEAITTIPAPTPELKDKIVDCTTKGYMMNEKVIRHAKVVVGA